MKPFLSLVRWSERNEHERCMKPRRSGRRPLRLVVSSLLHVGLSPSPPQPQPPCGWTAVALGPRSCQCRPRQEGSLEAWRKALCPRVGLPLVFMVLTYTEPPGPHRLLYRYVHIHIWGCKYLVLCINKTSLFLIFRCQFLVIFCALICNISYQKLSKRDSELCFSAALKEVG